MIGPKDISEWALAQYGNFLRSVIDGAPLFPLRRDRLGRVPAFADPKEFAAAVEPLWRGSKQVRGVGYTVVLEERQRRKRAFQNEPVAVVIETEDDYVELLEKREEVAKFRADVALIAERLPQGLRALRQSPAVVIGNAGDWPGILEVAEYLKENPRPGCYVRALPVQVPTKFIETHREAIELLLGALPECGYDPAGRTFARRCGFAEEQPAIRGRFLCADLRRTCGFPTDDVVLRVESWAALTVPNGIRVAVCENRTNFLALPEMPGVLALWGEGGAVTGLLPRIPWLRQARVVYWGDLDPCGLGILAGLRQSLPDVVSILMDEATLVRHSDKLLVAKSPPGRIDRASLQPHELAAFERLADPVLGIEQEKLLFQECLAELSAALHIHG